MAKKHPDIVVLMADTVTRDALGCYGSFVRTPNIDALATRSHRFERLYQPANMCQPSRTTWLTGHYPSSTQIYLNNGDYDRRHPTLLKHLATNGYRGGYLGLFHSWRGFDRDGLQDWSWIDWDSDFAFASGRGSWEKQDEDREEWRRHVERMGMIEMWDRLVDFHDHAGRTDIPLELHPTTRLTDTAVASVDDFSAERPNLLWVSSWFPHEPWAPPAPFDGMYGPDEVVLPGNLRDPRSTRPIHQRTSGNDAPFLREPGGEALLRRIWAAYGGCMSFVDQQFGRIIDRLKTRGLYDDALVVFMTDHGTTHGAHGWMYKGGSFMIDEISRIPVLVKLPGQREAKTIPDIVSSADFFPTVLELLGIGHAPVDGSSWSDVFAGRRRANARAFGQHGDGRDEDARSARMLRRGRWKYTMYSKAGVDELYDMEADPLELRNIAEDSPRERKELRDELVDVIRSGTDAFVVR